MATAAERKERKRAAGLCIWCSFPVFKGGRCYRHYQAHMNAKSKKHIAACCGRAGRLEVLFLRALLQVAKSPQAPESERVAARAKLEGLMGAMKPEARANFEEGLILIGAKEKPSRKRKAA